jgi:CHAT domain-containing protein
MKKKYLNFLLIFVITLGIVFLHNIKVNSQESTDAATELESIDTEQLSSAIDKLEAKWERDYENHFQKDFNNNSRSAPEIAEHLKEIAQQTNLKPAVIWAMPLPEFLELMLVTPDNQVVMKEIRGADSKTLELIISQLNTALNDRTSTKYLPPAKQLYRWLFEPLESYLAAENIDTLLLCTGPSLRSLPFAVLHDGERFAIEKYNLSRIPAFNLTDTSYQALSDRRVLAMGASTFSDNPDLPGVEVELDTITPKLLPGRRMLNQEFTIENLIKEHKQGKFNIVHLATHSEFKPGAPSNSYIQFNNRKLTIDQIDNLNLSNPPVDLLVLSACKTALGDKEAEFGFAGLAMQAGVKSALASLWSINDTGTLALMSEFYQQLRLNPIKAEALRKAQLAMLKGNISIQGKTLKTSDLSIPLPPEITESEQPDLTHPYNWAGFTIIGNPW